MKITSAELAIIEMRLAHNRKKAGQVDAPCGGTFPAKESELHAQIIAECKRRGWKYVHSDMSRPSTNGEGVCDFIIYCDGGRVMNVECKRKGGKLSEGQRVFRAWLEKLGHEVHVVENFAQFFGLAISPRWQAADKT